jgi:hypothetical protein
MVWRLRRLVAAAMLLAPQAASAAGAELGSPGCSPGAVPAYRFGFAELHVQLGDTMGEPVSCEYADPKASGDVLQTTSHGLAFWRKSTNTPTFTDGSQHWAITADGLVIWTDNSIDPPGVQPPPAPNPMPPALPASVASTHDWRAPGYAAAIGGMLYDPLCIPLDSVGSNVLNLPFRSGLDEDLQWMAAHNMRWLRVLATGHGLGPDRAPRDASVAIADLQVLLNRVDAFNASRASSQSIYVLVGLTDYYPPGVPGDGHAYDHPTFKDVPVLPAPWYRAGIPFFGFDQEHGFGQESGLPNYEQLYKPWVQTIVSALAEHTSLLGWQLGNELKARGSPRNNISSEQAYSWYLAFTQDIVDTIRTRDRHHLIFTGTQYVAELTDYEYRPRADLAPELVAGYRQLHQRLLDACGEWCWNVLGLTYYDFNPYALDDALLARQAQVAAAMIEYGFTNGPTDTTQDRLGRYGGDRAAAVRDGWAHAWKGLDGSVQTRFPGAADLVIGGTVVGVAPWASPSPQSGPDRGVDLDAQRGVTDAPDAAAVWDAWSATGARLEAANQAAGPAPACLAAHSS